MRNHLKWVFWILVLLPLAACGGLNGWNGPARNITVLESSGGKATIACTSPCDWGFGWLAYGPGMQVASGDRIRVGNGDGNYIELRDNRSKLILGPGAMAVLEVGSTDFKVTQIRLRLEYGSLYAASNGSLGEGYLEVETSAGTVSLEGVEGGSELVASYETGSRVTLIACLKGSLTVQAASLGSSPTVLSAGTTITYDRGQPAYQTFAGQPPGSDPLLWQVLENRRQP